MRKIPIAKAKMNPKNPRAGMPRIWGCMLVVHIMLEDMITDAITMHKIISPTNVSTRFIKGSNPTGSIFTFV